MKKDTFWIASIVLFLLNIFLIYKYLSIKNDSQRYANTFDIIQKQNLYLWSLDSLQFSSNGRCIDIQAESLNNTIITNDSLLKTNQQICVLRLRETNCLDCNIDLINYWNSLTENIKKKSKFVVLVEFQNPNSFRNFAETQKIKGILLNTRKSKLNINLEAQEKPFIFILNNQNQVISPFVADKSFIERTYSYFGFLNQAL